MGQEFVLLVSASIFCVGAAGFMIRKNPLIMFMSVELMLNSVNFLLVTYSSFLNSLDGQIFALFIMTVAAAEVVVGLAITTPPAARAFNNFCSMAWSGGLKRSY